MNATAGIIIAIGAVVVLAALAFVTLARRSDVRGAGALSGETRKRDEAARARARRAAEADAREAGDPASRGTVGEPASRGTAGEPASRGTAGEPASRGTAEPVLVGASVARTAAEAEAEGAVARRGTAIVPISTDTGLTPWLAPDPEVIGVSRRQFFNRSIIALMGATIGTFSAGSFVAFLWPTKTGGFGGRVSVGALNDILSTIDTGDGFFYAPEARAWITRYPAEAIPKAEVAYQPALLPGIQRGVIASYQKCPHLGCRVPSCPSSQWFECGCHGSQYNHVGEKKGGPAPRGMDHFAVDFEIDQVVVDTGTVWQGQPIGTNTTGQEAEGPHCVGAAEH
jgi:cytochrome b6-f complex iron-sulfur subunit